MRAGYGRRSIPRLPPRGGCALHPTDLPSAIRPPAFRSRPIPESPCFAASRANELAPIAQALAGALMAEGIIAGVSASAGPQMEGRPNVIVIEIGRKP